MPLPVLPGVLRITASGQCAGGGQWANTWHAYNGGAAWDAASITAFDAIFSQFYIGPGLGAGGAPILQYLSPGSSVDGIAYTPLDGASGAFLHAHAAAGVAPASSMPAEVAMVMTIRTLQRGRQNRGRVYLPPFRQDVFLSNGHLGPTDLAHILEQIAAVQAAIVTGGGTLGVGSYGPYKDPVTHLPILTGQHFTPVSVFTMDDSADVQRGRKT
jgi:hypothetical protein